MSLSCFLPPADADVRRVETGGLFAKAMRCEWIHDGARVEFDGSTGMGYNPAIHSG
jgi:hypothetical protein